MSHPDEKGRGPVRRAVTEVFSKGAPAPAKLALPLSLFLLPPAMAAEEPGQAADDLPVVFVAPPPESEVSAATVERLQAITAIARLQRVAALEPELNELKYTDPVAALAKLGIEVPETVKVTVSRDEASGEDRVTVQGASFATALRFDGDGQFVAMEEDTGGFAARATMENFDRALDCCWNAQSAYGNWCSARAQCQGSATCQSKYFVGIAAASPDGVMPCLPVGYY